MCKNKMDLFPGFLHIGFYIETPKDFLSLSLVCKDAARACRQLRELKKWQFERIFVSYDGDVWKLFEKQDEAMDYSVEGIERGVQLIYRHMVLETPAVFRMRRIEIFDLPETKKCQCDWEICMEEFLNK